ncbi:hypothetical protein BRD01_15475 [Halobacteriales archaeon QS_8_65_32]|nr:MAG: hypothetical protein BRD01_15475 [Halobacteriales archaeon QS_8_65_32]
MIEIVRAEGVLGGEPRIDGHRISVLQVAEMIYEGGYGSEHIADRLDISLAEVHAALSYYYEHPDEMDAFREHHREFEAQLKSESSAPSTVEQ